MRLHAIEVTGENLPLIAYLNFGVAPRIEEKPTYFIFDTDTNSNVPGHVIKEEFLLTHYESTGRISVLSIE